MFATWFTEYSKPSVEIYYLESYCFQNITVYWKVIWSPQSSFGDELGDECCYYAYYNSIHSVVYG
jgi:hypothetical protein